MTVERPIAGAEAADFSSALDDYGGTIAVSGTIEPGDLAKLVAELGDHRAKKGGPITLELNSKGGDFKEALEIAQFSLDRNLSTRIAPQAECLSACAIIFMTGTHLMQKLQRDQRIEPGILAISGNRRQLAPDGIDGHGSWHAESQR